MGSLNSNVQAASGPARAANASLLSFARSSCPEAVRVRAARAIRLNDCCVGVSGMPLRPDIDRLPPAQRDRALPQCALAWCLCLTAARLGRAAARRDVIRSRETFK